MKPQAKGGPQDKIGSVYYIRQLGQLLSNFNPQEAKKTHYRLEGMHLRIAAEHCGEVAAQAMKRAPAIHNPTLMLWGRGDEGLMPPAG